MSNRPFDKDKMFNDATSMASGFTTAASPVTSANVVDMGTADGDELNPPRVAVHIEGGDSVADTGTIQVVLQDSVDGSTGWVTIQTGKVSAGNATDFNPYAMFVPPKHRRYLRTQYVIATNNFSAGTLHAGIV